ncbi:MAG: hypothetical protein JNJ45_07085 [Chthonomonas sp.]|nr:hypothetical protein [Chthonomonas sp.]
MVRTLAGFGPAYFEDFVLPQFYGAARVDRGDDEALAAALDDPIVALRLFLRSYAFARRGKDRQPLSDAASGALKRAVEANGPDALLKGEDGEAVWDFFVEECAEQRIKPMEQLNRGVVQGMVELAQEVYRLPDQPSICTWIRVAIENRGELALLFERIVDIRGVGPKTASCFLRDVVAVFDLEEDIPNVDRLIMQPIDRWVRSITLRYAPDIHDEDPVDWVLAGKAYRLARLAEVGGIDYNMGCTWFGLKQVRRPELLDAALRAVERD